MIDLIKEYPQEARALLEYYEVLRNRKSSNIGSRRCIDILMGNEEISKPTNQQLIDEYKVDSKDKGDGSKWRNDVERIMKKLFEETGKDAFEITYDDFVSFYQKQKRRKGQLGRMKVMPSTIRKNFSKISSFYMFLKREGYLLESPYQTFYEKKIKRYTIHNKRRKGKRQLVSLEQMRMLIKSCLHPRDKLILLLSAKIGIRATEMMQMDIGDVNWDNQSIYIKERKTKEIFALVFYDDECERFLKVWLNSRECFTTSDNPALFVNDKGDRLNHHHLDKIVKHYAIHIGLHKENGSNTQERFTYHCFRKFFSSILRQNGMPREIRKILRGDKLNETIDDYDEYAPDELREYYLKYMPKFYV